MSVEKKGYNVSNKPSQNNGDKRGFVLPVTTSKPPMPVVKPPKKPATKNR